MKILCEADYCVSDGNGLYVAALMQKGVPFLRACFWVMTKKNAIHKQYGELIKGSDLTKDVLKMAKNREKKQKVLIIDKKNPHPKNDFERKKAEYQKSMAVMLEKKFPNNDFLVIFDGEKTPQEIAKMVIDQGIEVVFSCIGMKTQEQRLTEIFHHIPENFPVLGLGVGASIDFLLGLQKRAPKMVRDAGFEWLYRLVMQPKIRARRIKTALMDFPCLVKKEAKRLK